MATATTAVLQRWSAATAEKVLRRGWDPSPQPAAQTTVRPPWRTVIFTARFSVLRFRLVNKPANCCYSPKLVDHCWKLRVLQLTTLLWSIIIKINQTWVANDGNMVEWTITIATVTKTIVIRVRCGFSRGQKNGIILIETRMRKESLALMDTAVSGVFLPPIQHQLIAVVLVVSWGMETGGWS